MGKGSGEHETAGERKGKRRGYSQHLGIPQRITCESTRQRMPNDCMPGT
jgi:hypothetical protein